MEGSAHDKQGPEGGSVAGVLGPARPPFLWRGRSARLLLFLLLFISQREAPAFPDENFTGKSWLVGRRWLEGERKMLAFQLVSANYNMHNPYLWVTFLEKTMLYLPCFFWFTRRRLAILYSLWITNTWRNLCCYQNNTNTSIWAVRNYYVYYILSC